MLFSHKNIISNYLHYANLNKILCTLLESFLFCSIFCWTEDKSTTMYLCLTIKITINLVTLWLMLF